VRVTDRTSLPWSAFLLILALIFKSGQHLNSCYSAVILTWLYSLKSFKNLFSVCNPLYFLSPVLSWRLQRTHLSCGALQFCTIQWTWVEVIFSASKDEPYWIWTGDPSILSPVTLLLLLLMYLFIYCYRCFLGRCWMTDIIPCLQGGVGGLWGC